MTFKNYLMIKHSIALVLGLMLLLNVSVSAQTPEVISNDRPIFTIVEQMPVFVGGESAMLAYIQKRLNFPKTAVEANVSGRVFVSFVVEVDGKITSVKVLKGIGYGCDEEAVRVVSGMPAWIPGKQNGINVAVKYNLPIQYRLKDSEETLASNSNAEFPGGEESLKNFIKLNLNYPIKAKRKKVQGICTIQFTVLATGMIDQPQLQNKLGYGCNEEAIRLFQLLPKKWKPAQKNGEAINSIYILSIPFQL
jgi:TonB family protein